MKKITISIAGLVVAFIIVKTVLVNMTSDRLESGREVADSVYSQIKTEAEDLSRGANNLSEIDAMQIKADEMHQKTLASKDTRQEKRQYALSVFMGFHFINAKSRFDYCQSRGIDITGFVDAFTSTNSFELEEGQKYISDLGLSESEYYSMLHSPLEEIVAKDMQSIAKSNGMTTQEVCVWFNESANYFASNLDFSLRQPDIHKLILSQ